MFGVMFLAAPDWQMKLYSKEETKRAATTNVIGAVGVLAWLGVASYLVVPAKEGNLLFIFGLTGWFGVGVILYAKFRAANKKQLAFTSHENITRFNLSILYHLIFRR